MARKLLGFRQKKKEDCAGTVPTGRETSLKQKKERCSAIAQLRGRCSGGRFPGHTVPATRILRRKKPRNRSPHSTHTARFSSGGFFFSADCLAKGRMLQCLHGRPNAFNPRAYRQSPVAPRARSLLARQMRVRCHARIPSRLRGVRPLSRPGCRGYGVQSCGEIRQAAEKAGDGRRKVVTKNAKQKTEKVLGLGVLF